MKLKFRYMTIEGDNASAETITKAIESFFQPPPPDPEKKGVSKSFDTSDENDPDDQA